MMKDWNQKVNYYRVSTENHDMLTLFIIEYWITKDTQYEFSVVFIFHDVFLRLSDENQHFVSYTQTTSCCEKRG